MVLALLASLKITSFTNNSYAACEEQHNMKSIKGILEKGPEIPELFAIIACNLDSEFKNFEMVVKISATTSRST